MLFRRSRPKFVPVAKTESVRRLLDVAPIKLGSNNDRVVAVFFDFKCPYCARLFRETEEYFADLAFRGILTYIMCDYIVHKSAEPLHRALRCIPEEERLEFVAQVFNGGEVKVGDCPGESYKECERLAEEVGVYGTPTLLLYDLKKGRGYMHFGYLMQDEVVEAVLEYLLR